MSHDQAKEAMKFYQAVARLIMVIDDDDLDADNADRYIKLKHKVISTIQFLEEELSFMQHQEEVLSKINNPKI